MEDVSPVKLKEERHQEVCRLCLNASRHLIFWCRCLKRKPFREQHTPIQGEIMVFELCSSWSGSLYLSDIQVAVLK